MFDFTLEGTLGAARAGTLTLPHGTVRTPAFMPVGTHGVVRGLSAADVRRTGAQIILGNTYHLHIRPGEDVVREMGGLHRFTTWDRPMLTDSGGFQVFSLEGLRRIKRRTGRITSDLIAEDPELPGVHFYRKRFGGLSGAYARVGYTPIRGRTVAG